MRRQMRGSIIQAALNNSTLRLELEYRAPLGNRGESANDLGAGSGSPFSIHSPGIATLKEFACLLDIT
jgi:hypothetical protein